MAATIYDHISKNNRNTILILALFPIILIIMVFIAIYLALLVTLDSVLLHDGIILAGKMHLNFWRLEGLPLNDYKVLLTASFGYIAVVALPIIGITVLWSVISYFLGDKMILSASSARAIKKSDSPDIYRLVENVAIAAGLPCPKLYIINDESLNAFATGRNPENASISLTTGIIKALNRQELETVIAHEMAHIGNRDIRLMMLIITGIGAITFISDVLFRTLRTPPRSNSKNGNAGAVFLLMLFVAIALALFSLVVAPLLRFALSRAREYGADTTAAMITRNPGALANALEKISQDSRVEALDNMPTVGALCIENPLGKNRKRLFDSLAGLYATHPPTDKRISALREMAGF